MAFDGTEGSSIDLTTASEWTANFRDNKPSNPSSSSYPNAHFFGKDILEDILAQTGCMGIRIYYALDENGIAKLVLTGADSQEDDQLGTNDTIAEYGSPCPPHCGTANSLNA